MLLTLLTFGWPWPIFRVVIGHWPDFALYMISQVIVNLGSSCFTWIFPTPNQSCFMCHWPSPTFKVAMGHWPNFALYKITHIIMELWSSNCTWRFPVPYLKAKLQYVYGWPWPTSEVNIGHWHNFTLCFISQLIIKLGSSDWAWRFPVSVFV
jgi:hypothetical protein